MAERPTREEIDDVVSRFASPLEPNSPQPDPVSHRDAMMLLAELDALTAERDEAMLHGKNLALGYERQLRELAALRTENERLIEPCAKCSCPPHFVAVPFLEPKRWEAVELGCDMCSEVSYESVADWNAAQRRARDEKGER